MQPSRAIDSTPRNESDTNSPPPVQEKKKGGVKAFFSTLFGGNKNKTTVIIDPTEKLVPDLQGLEQLNQEGRGRAKQAVSSVSVQLGQYESSDNEELKIEPTPSRSETQSTATSSASRSPSVSPLFFGAKPIKNDWELLFWLADKKNYPWLWDALCICNEAIIETAELFSLITAQKGDFLDDFCVLWLNHNRHTKLFGKAKGFLPAKIADESEIEARFAPHVPQLPLQVTRVKLGTDKLDIIKMIAEDLMQEQKRVYFALTPDVFIEEKWEQQPDSIRQYIHHQRRLASFVEETILRASNDGTRTDLMFFFLEICSHSLALHDFATAGSIYNGFTKLPEIVQEQLINEIEHVDELLQELKQLSSDSHIEEMVKMQKGYIPYIIPYLRSLEKAIKMDKLDAEFHYNLEKLRYMYDAIHLFLAEAERCRGEPAAKLKTDFIAAHLHRYVPMKKEERELALFMLDAKKNDLKKFI